MKKIENKTYYKCNFCNKNESLSCENSCFGCGKLICLYCRKNITFTPFNLNALQDVPDTLCKKCNFNLKEFKKLALDIELETQLKLKELTNQWLKKCN